MDRMPIRLLGVGQTLDRSFQLYRTLFTPLFLLTLLAFSPFYLISNLLLIDIGALSVFPKFDGFENLESFWLSRFPEQLFSGGIDLWIKIAGTVLLALLLAFVALPLHLATGVILANRAIDGEETGLVSAFREALKRYWRVLGNGLLFWLICIGIYVGVMTANGMLSLLYGAVVMSSAALSPSSAAATVSGVIFLVMYLVFTYAGTLAYYYFVIRFGMFLPPVLFENEGVGIGRSWSLTRKSFWPLLGIYFIFGVLMYAFSIAIVIVFAALGVTITGLLSILFLFCAILPAGLVVYTVAYRVQKLRCDGEDIEHMLTAARGEA
ncbi:hypothetical protein [Paenibacillus alkalitolerans]|uniref:hypothetical protein n=1 Tax=Paenibacillus alkalitolerans TaxID=2799335 RepID=UPI0018F68CFF|nr:hypothetical protein [Paenibacillus alkalitolerans]